MRTTLILLLLSVCNIGFSQDAPPQHEHIKSLTPFIGVWEGKYDPPGEPPIGTVRITCEWMGNKSYLHMKGVYIPDAAPEVKLNVSNVFIGYNGKTKAIHAWHLDLGSQSEAAVKIMESKVVMQTVDRYGTDGRRSKRTSTFGLKSKDEMIISHTNITSNGEPKPDEPPLMVKRVKK